MSTIDKKDREILRSLAHRYMGHVHSAKNEAIMKKWEAQGEGRKDTPTIRLCFDNIEKEVIVPRQQCTGKKAREIEAIILRGMTGRELFDDDTPMEAALNIPWDTWVNPFGIFPKQKKASDENDRGYHIEPVIEDLERDIDMLRGGYYYVNKENTFGLIDQINDVIGDILPARRIQNAMTGFILNPLIALMGMENYYFSMYDCPDTLHEIMDLATSVYESYYDYLEKEKLLLPTQRMSYVGMGTYAFNHELPTENVTKTTECWGALEAQEATAISNEYWREFVLPYQERLISRFGLLSYGCCENVDTIWDDFLSKWDKLRKLSVSPFSDHNKVGEFLRGSNIVFYSKPRTEYLTNPGPINKEALMEYYKEICQAASGCMFEIAQREALSIYGDYNRGREYVAILKECVERYWRP